MSNAAGTGPLASDPRHEELRRRSIELLLLGVAFLALGAIALVAVGLATLASILVFGWLLAIGGVVQVIDAFRRRGRGERLARFLLGLFYLAVGGLVIANTVAGAAGATLAIAALFLAAGAFRIALALSERLPRWGWLLVSGCVDLVLAVLVISTWPLSTIWTIGALVGVELLFVGWADVPLALAIHEGERPEIAPAAGGPAVPAV
ncbi:MAG TPA: DUF308 domain-containing protein [Planctomycetota bacterium]|nr:DUF308 domain-containing protein [Planctomycetota bacterium]